MHIYMHPTKGDDANGGTGPDDAVLTHERVCEILDSLPAPQGVDIYVLLTGKPDRSDDTFN